VINNYPKSYKLAGAMLKKAQAYQEMGQKATAARQYHEVIRRFPGTDEAHRAEARLRQVSSRCYPSVPDSSGAAVRQILIP
jgi:TolA-binding protein